MKNIQIIDGADNATFSIFQATDEEYEVVFPEGRESEAGRVLTPIWDRPILKRDAMGVHGTLFYDNENRIVPPSKREIDWHDSSINPAQRTLFSRYR